MVDDHGADSNDHNIVEFLSILDGQNCSLRLINPFKKESPKLGTIRRGKCPPYSDCVIG